MVEHKCDKCGTVYYKKSHWLQHINKKKSCYNNQSGTNINNNILSVPIQNPPNNILNISFDVNKWQGQYILDNYNIPEFNANSIHLDDLDNSDDPDEKICCAYCLKTFCRKDVLNKHLKNSCKVKKQQDEQKEDIFKKLLLQESMLKQKDEQIYKLISQNDVLIGKINVLEEKVDKISQGKKPNCKNTNANTNTNTNNIANLTNNTTNNNTTNNTNNNTNNGVIFNLVNYGKEDLDQIDTKYFINNVVKNNKVSGVKIPEEILKLIHFNPAHPELNNIYISDINREKCMIYDDGMWKLTNEDKIPEVIDKVVKYSYNKQDELREKYGNNKYFLDRLNVIDKYTKFTDSEYLEELKDEQFDGDADNKDIIKRCEDFQKKTYETFKTTMYNEGLKIKKNIRKV